MAVVFLIYFTSLLSYIIHAMCHSNCYNRSLIDKDRKKWFGPVLRWDYSAYSFGRRKNGGRRGRPSATAQDADSWRRRVWHRFSLAKQWRPSIRVQLGRKLRVTDMRVATMDARSPAIRVMNFGGEVIIQRIYVLESNGSASVALHRILTRFVLAPFYCKNKFLLTVSRDYTVEPY